MSDERYDYGKIETGQEPFEALMFGLLLGILWFIVGFGIGVLLGVVLM